LGGGVCVSQLAADDAGAAADVDEETGGVQGGMDEVIVHHFSEARRPNL